MAVTLVNLANAHGDLGDTQTKKQMLEWALAILEPHYGKNHPQVAITLTNLANAHGDLGDTQTKKQMLERALAIQEPHYGQDHPEVATTLVEFNEAFNQGQFQQAIAFGQQYAKESSTPHHIYHNLACVCHIAGEIEKAKDCFSKAIEATPSAAVYTAYAFFLFCQKRFEEVLQPIQLALAAEKIGGLGYGKNEISTVEPFMATLIQEKGQIL